MQQRMSMGIVAFDVNLPRFFVDYSTGYCQTVVIMFVVQRSDTMNILQKIFYGSLTPYEYEQSTETRKLSDTVLDEEDALLKSLSDNEQTLKDSLQDVLERRISLMALAERDAYLEGFKLGVKLTTEIYTDK